MISSTNLTDPQFSRKFELQKIKEDDICRSVMDSHKPIHDKIIEG